MPTARKTSLACACTLGAMLVAFMWPAARGTAHASQAPEELRLRPSEHERSMSVGYPWHGHLERGMRLEDPELIVEVPEYAEHDRFYGTWQLVQLVRRAAQHVAQRFAGSKLAVGELSAQSGGRIPGHHSHRNGRDIDIGFYLQGDTGEQAFARNFVKMRKSAKGNFAGQVYRFDDARNWALLSKLLVDDDARVQFVFVASTLQKRLIAEAEREGADALLITRAKAVMMEPREGNLHQSHFHVRIYCPEEDRPFCSDRPPYFPWYQGIPPSGEYASMMRGIPLTAP